MRKSKFTDKAIKKILNQWKNGAKVSALIKEHGITAPTLYIWSKKFDIKKNNTSKKSKIKKIPYYNAKDEYDLAKENKILRSILANKLLDECIRVASERFFST